MVLIILTLSKTIDSHGCFLDSHIALTELLVYWPRSLLAFIRTVVFITAPSTA